MAEDEPRLSSSDVRSRVLLCFRVFLRTTSLNFWVWSAWGPFLFQRHSFNTFEHKLRWNMFVSKLGPEQERKRICRPKRASVVSSSVAKNGGKREEAGGKARKRSKSLCSSFWKRTLVEPRETPDSLQRARHYSLTFPSLCNLARGPNLLQLPLHRLHSVTCRTLMSVCLFLQVLENRVQFLTHENEMLVKINPDKDSIQERPASPSVFIFSCPHCCDSTPARRGSLKNLRLGFTDKPMVNILFRFLPWKAALCHVPQRIFAGFHHVSRASLNLLLSE